MSKPQLSFVGDPNEQPSSSEAGPDATDLLHRVAKGDDAAFAQLYDALASHVYGLARRVVRDPARAEEVTQEVFLQVWRTASRFDAARGSGKTWVMTLAHRRAVDVVRHDQAASEREKRYDWSAGPDHDSVAETAAINLEHEQVTKCLSGLTELQLEAINLAYYQGFSYPQVSATLDVSLSAIKTRIRDGLIRIRDCLGVQS